jgi:hypothetical protein
MSHLVAPLSCSGFELVSRVLDHPEGGVEALIGLAVGGETDWLEFKAAMLGRPQDRKKDENDADGYWNVAEAVLAMANSRGGVVLLGVDDDANAVGLAAGDPRRTLETRGMDAFLRMEVLDRIHPPNSCCRWSTGRKGVWELERPWPPDQFVIRPLQYQGKPIAALLVKPVPAEKGCLIVNQNGEERLLKRVEGNLGRVESLRGRVAIPEYERSRCPSGADLGSLLTRFLKRVEKGGSEEDDLEASIEAWHRKFQQKNADLNATFTPMDVEERLNLEDCFEMLLPSAAFEPQTEEILPDYVSEYWMEDDPGHPPGDGEPSISPASPRSARRGGLFELLSEEPRAVLVGEPGGGKTTCLRRLTLDSALQYQPGQTVTLFLPLAKWASSGGLSTLVRRTTNLSMGQVERLVSAGRCRLLFDGLNECPDSLRPAAINELTALLENDPNLPVVISTRSAEAVAHLRLPTFSVQPLSDSQQIQFLKAYLPDPERAAKLFAQIQAQPGAETFASNPLLLRMIVEVAGRDGELPMGRALLYRRWIRDWYRREREKAARAKDPLPWNEEQTLEGLSAIALAARMRGSRIANEEEALDALQGLVANRADFLRRMTQSPLLRREDGHLQFRHETFQEYLCAEALLLHPENLQADGPERYGTWGMPLAYAAELSDPLPEKLKGAMWRIAPWLAAALSQPGDPTPSLSGTLGSLIRWATSEDQPSPSPRLLIDRDWYSADAPLRYAVSEPEARWRRWHAFEVSQILACESDAILAAVLRRTLTFTKQSRYLRRDERVDIAERMGIEQAALLLIGELLGRNDFTPEKRSFLLGAANGPQALTLLKAGIVSTDDFRPEKRLQLFAAANAAQAVELIKAGIAPIHDSTVERWGKLLSATRDAQVIIELLKTGIVSENDFTVEKLRKFLASIKNAQLVELAKTGLISKQKLFSALDEQNLFRCVRLNLFSRDEFTPEKRVQLLAGVNTSQAFTLAKAGIVSRDDFTPEKRVELIAYVNVIQALELTESGILSKDDFTPEKRLQLLGASDSAQDSIALELKLIQKLVDFGIISTKELVTGSNAKQACVLVKKRIVSKNDFSPEKRARLLATANAEQAAELALSGIVSRDDFSSEKRAHLLTAANAEKAIELVEKGILSRDDFTGEQRSQFVAAANLVDALHFLRSGLITMDDFDDKKRRHLAALDNTRWINGYVNADIVLTAGLIPEYLQQLRSINEYEKLIYFTDLDAASENDRFKAEFQQVKDCSTVLISCSQRTSPIAQAHFDAACRFNLATTASPEEILKLIENGTLSTDDFDPESRFHLAIRSDNQQLLALVKAGILESVSGRSKCTTCGRINRVQSVPLLRGENGSS